MAEKDGACNTLDMVQACLAATALILASTGEPRLSGVQAPRPKASATALLGSEHVPLDVNAKSGYLSQQHIENLLKSRGILAAVDPDWGGDIWVKARDASRAQSILEADAIRRPWHYWRLGNPRLGARLRILTKDWESRYQVVLCPVKEGPLKGLEKVLLRTASKMLRNPTVSVSVCRVWRMPYLDKHGHEAAGWRVYFDTQLGSLLDEDWLGCEVWDGLKKASPASTVLPDANLENDQTAGLLGTANSDQSEELLTTGGWPGKG